MLTQSWFARRRIDVSRVVIVFAVAVLVSTPVRPGESRISLFCFSSRATYMYSRAYVYIFSLSHGWRFYTCGDMSCLCAFTW